MSLANLIILLVIIAVVYLARRARSSGELTSVARGSRSEDIAMENGTEKENQSEAPAPEIYKIVRARIVHVAQGLAFCFLALATTRGYAVFVLLTCGAMTAAKFFRAEVIGTWLESHFSRAIRTGWWVLLWSVVVGAVAAIQFDLQGSTLIQWPGFLIIGIWLALRIVPSWTGLRSQLPININGVKRNMSIVSVAIGALVFAAYILDDNLLEPDSEHSRDNPSPAPALLPQPDKNTAPAIVAGPADVAPFGLPIGKATLADVRKELSSKGQRYHLEKNEWTQGPELTVYGDGLGIEGMERVFFIFDSQEKLLDVKIDLDKSRYYAMKAHLEDKYKKISEEKPKEWGFSDSETTTFRSGPIAIIAKSPRMSFECSVEYIHDEYAVAREAGAEQKRQQQWEEESTKL